MNGVFAARALADTGLAERAANPPGVTFDQTLAQVPPGRLTSDERLTAMRAGHEARVRYPEPVAEVLREAISAYLSFGFRCDQLSAVPRLIRELAP